MTDTTSTASMSESIQPSASSQQSVDSLDTALPSKEVHKIHLLEQAILGLVNDLGKIDLLREYSMIQKILEKLDRNRLTAFDQLCDLELDQNLEQTLLTSSSLIGNSLLSLRKVKERRTADSNSELAKSLESLAREKRKLETEKQALGKEKALLEAANQELQRKQAALSEEKESFRLSAVHHEARAKKLEESSKRLREDEDDMDQKLIEAVQARKARRASERQAGP